MTAIEVGDDLAQLDRAVGALPNHPAVFLLWPREGAPYLSKTGLLRRRLLRLLKERERPSRLLNLRHAVRRIEYWLTGSSLESSVVMYEQARRHFPETYLELLKLRMPPYVKIVLGNEFPRSHISTHLTKSAGLYFGPFRSRASAERFEGQFLDLFQMRRCQEDLAPTPEHPGCIYGEMGMCLRPCQQVVGAAEYGHEVARVVEFLQTDGRSLLEAIGRSRDRLSEEMKFEDAARQHKRFEKVQEVLKLRDDLARDVDRLYGVEEGVTVSLDRKLRESFAGVEARKLRARERREYLALLARWYYSSWREGEWLGFERVDDIPYRKLVNAVSRVGGAGRQLV